jgi:hypothetical protein
VAHSQNANDGRALTHTKAVSSRAAITVAFRKPCRRSDNNPRSLRLRKLNHFRRHKRYRQSRLRSFWTPIRGPDCLPDHVRDKRLGWNTVLDQRPRQRTPDTLPNPESAHSLRISKFLLMRIAAMFCNCRQTKSSFLGGYPKSPSPKRLMPGTLKFRKRRCVGSRQWPFRICHRE